MKGLGNDKLSLILLVLTFLANKVSSRSFRKIRGADSPTLSIKDEILNPVSSFDFRGDHVHNKQSGSTGIWRNNRLNNLVNVIDNKFSAEDQSQLGNNEENPGEESRLSLDELEMIKKRILDGLGLTTIPTRNLSNIPDEEIEMAYKDYEKAVQEEEKRHRAQLEEEEEAKEEDEEDEELGEENKSTNISSSSFRFYSSKVTKKLNGRDRRSANNGQQIVHFYVSLPTTSLDTNSSHVIEATSRFWKKGIYSRDANATSSTIPVSFYRLDDIPRGKFRYTKLDPVFIATKNVSIYGNEWIEVDMINAVRSWLNNPKSDTGVLIKCPDCEAAGIKFLTGGHRKGLGTSNKVPRLDVRTEVIGLRRVKRSRKMRKSLKKNIHHHADCHDATHPRGKRSNRCCRRSMQVRFADLPRFDFILSPKEFDAYYCSGKCPARYNPANEHALLQSLLNLRGKNNVPGPCCAPTKLKGLNILHIGDDGRIKTTFWRDVIVTECGCA